MLKVQEVADILHAHPNTVRHWCNEGLLKAHRIGPRGDRRFLPEDVESFLTSYSRDQQGKIEIEGDAVLIVEDDPRFSDLMKDVIEEEGYKVVVCGTVEAALKEIAKQQFALVFLDLVLPGESGIDVLRTIKSKEEKSVVAVMTGYGDDPIALKAMELGPMFFLRKPFNMSNVIEILNVTVGAKR
jgi:excisionase family DNA binding protein